MAPAAESPSVLLRRARAGEPQAADELLGLYRNYVRLLARTQLAPDLCARLDPSDLVQETLIEARRDLLQFAGSSERQLLGWLRRILARRLANEVRHHRARQRDCHQQCSLEDQLERSSATLERAVAASISSPSAQAARRERAVILADAIARLPDDYREVVILRHLEDAPFSEIAARMGRSAGAVRMLWVRALERLRVELKDLA